MSTDQTSLLYTAQAGKSSLTGGAQAKHGKGMAGADFMTLLFSLVPGGELKDGKNTDNADASLLAQTTLSSVPAVTQQAAPLDPSLLAPSGDAEGTDGMEQLMDAIAEALNVAQPGRASTAQDAADQASEPASETPTTTVRKQKDFMAFLQHLLSGLPADDKMMALDINQKFELSQDKPGAEAAPALIATGLTPEELTKFMEELSKRMPQLESMMAGMVKIQPATEKTQAMFSPRALIKPAAQPLTGGAKAAAETARHVETKLDDLIQAKADGADGMGEEGENGFGRILKTLEAAQQKGGTPATIQAAVKTQGPLSHASAQMSTVAARTLPLTGLSFPAGLSDQIYPDGMSWSHVPGMPGQVMTLTGPGPMTSLVGYAPAAAQPHPATQTIALTIGKAAIDGGPKSINVKLDPAELGRVEIRMEFDKDKGVKAHLIAEKPETYMMLQRDAQLLERALHDAGMMADSSGITFELAQDGSMSGERRGQGNDTGGGSTDTGGEMEDTNVIQARMDWYVDPDTGMTRYDLMA